jgi:hypothetical protein
MRSLLFIALLAACGGTSTPPETSSTPTTPPTGAACVIGGCSGTMCTDVEGMMSTCEYKAEYSCYGAAECKRQDNGSCGWTQTAELTACLANPPPMQ